MAAKELKQRGYEVLLVHPQAKELDGQVCYPDLKAVAGQVGGVVVCVPPAQAEGVLRQAGEAGFEEGVAAAGGADAAAGGIGQAAGVEHGVG